MLTELHNYLFWQLHFWRHKLASWTLGVPGVLGSQWSIPDPWLHSPKLRLPGWHRPTTLMSFKPVTLVCFCMPRLVSGELTGDWTAWGRVPSLWLPTKAYWVRLGVLRAWASYSCWPGMTDSWGYFSWTGRNCNYWREHWFDCELLPSGSVIMTVRAPGPVVHFAWTHTALLSTDPWNPLIMLSDSFFT